jgi:small subunit ribosomal protein S3e
MIADRDFSTLSDLPTLPSTYLPTCTFARSLAPSPSANSSRELAEEGYSGCEVRVTHARTEIIIRATHTQDVLGDKGRRIRELKALIEKRFKFPENSLELYAEKVQFRGLSAAAQAESLRYKLLGGLAMRR